jgi:uncharacterized membrane protein YhiD involved in acid resistance
MFDILKINGEGQHTSPELIVLALLLTFILSVILVIGYQTTSRQVSTPQHFIQSLMLMSIVTATIMQSIGDSLALSFGIFGALAIIRFRTRISDPRDVAFIFASMAIGIACGVHSFINAIIGTFAFCIIIFLIRFSPYGSKNNHVAEVKIALPLRGDPLVVNQVLASAKGNFTLRRTRYVNVDNNPTIEYDFRLKLENMGDASFIIDKLSAIENAKLIRFNFDDENFIESI